MDRDRATHEAYDGVRLELLNGAVAVCDPLTVAEAVRFLRMLKDIRDDRPGAHNAFVAEFPARVGLDSQRVADLGLVVQRRDGSDIDFGDLTYEEAAAIAELVAVASWHADDVERSDAQLEILDRYADLFGPSATPADVLHTARSFARELYLLIYGLAQDFCSHLTTTPPVRVMTLGTRRSKRASMT